MLKCTTPSCSPCLSLSSPFHLSSSFFLSKDLVTEVDDQFFFFIHSLKHVSKLQGTCKKMQLLNELMDRGGNYVAAALPFVVSLLVRGLAGRALLVAHSLPQTPEVMLLCSDTVSFVACGVSCCLWHCWTQGRDLF